MQSFNLFLQFQGTQLHNITSYTPSPILHSSITRIEGCVNDEAWYKWLFQSNHQFVVHSRLNFIQRPILDAVPGGVGNPLVFLMSKNVYLTMIKKNIRCLTPFHTLSLNRNENYGAAVLVTEAVITSEPMKYCIFSRKTHLKYTENSDIS